MTTLANKMEPKFMIPNLDRLNERQTGSRARTEQKKKIVVIGGGFAGLNFIKGLANDSCYEIVLVDKNNYHFFPPLLYQVGMAFIEPSAISYPFRRMFQHYKNVRFHLGNFIRVYPELNSVETQTELLHYDYLILALGTETNYFGMETVKVNALPLKNINDAIHLRNRLLLNLEKAVKTTDPERRRQLLTVVIAGGGATGIEVAGMLAEMAHKIGPKEYPEVARSGCEFSIYLIEASDTLLGSMNSVAREESFEVLTQLGIKIKLNTSVKEYINGKVLLSNGESIPTDALVWTSGVKVPGINGLPSESFGRGKRVLVNEHCKVKGTKNIYAIGDIALNFNDPRYPEGHPQVAQVAIQQGKLLAKNMKRMSKGNKLKPFRYHNKGSMAIISKFNAVADIGGITLRGVMAWLLWLFVHLIPIAGFRNKVRLAFNWCWSFITNDPTLRLIIRPNDKRVKQTVEQEQWIAEETFLLHEK